MVKMAESNMADTRIFFIMVFLALFLLLSGYLAGLEVSDAFVLSLFARPSFIVVNISEKIRLNINLKIQSILPATRIFGIEYSPENIVQKKLAGKFRPRGMISAFWKCSNLSQIVRNDNDEDQLIKHMASRPVSCGLCMLFFFWQMERISSTLTGLASRKIHIQGSILMVLQRGTCQI